MGVCCLRSLVTCVHIYWNLCWMNDIDGRSVANKAADLDSSVRSSEWILKDEKETFLLMFRYWQNEWTSEGDVVSMTLDANSNGSGFWDNNAWMKTQARHCFLVIGDEQKSNRADLIKIEYLVLSHVLVRRIRLKWAEIFHDVVQLMACSCSSPLARDFWQVSCHRE